MSEPLIHPTAIIDPSANLDSSVKVGPYSIIGANVNIGAGTEIGPHVVLKGHLDIEHWVEDTRSRLKFKTIPIRSRLIRVPPVTMHAAVAVSGWAVGWFGWACLRTEGYVVAPAARSVIRISVAAPVGHDAVTAV